MDLEQALAFTDALVFAKSGTHLSDLQQAMLRESWSWQRQSYDQIADTYGYSPTYLKHDVGPKLWRLLSEVLAEKVNKKNFRSAILRRYEESVQDSQRNSPSPAATRSNAAANSEITHQDWGDAPEISFFCGREIELDRLQQWSGVEQCRLVAILGIGGMGKTSIAVKFAQQVQNRFDWVVWRSLRNAPPLTDLLTEVLQVFTREAANEPSLLQLLNYLRSHRCLLILDNVETILQGGARYRSGYETYGELFQQIGQTRHQSCLILTSRETPPEIRLLEGENSPIRSLQLGGLTRSAGQELFRLKGAFRGADHEWNRLIAVYSGNPLALRIISTTIQNLFDGNIADFLEQNTFVFGSIRSLIEQQFQRLTDTEKTVMYWLAIYRDLTSFAELRADIFPPISPQQLIEVLESLEQRSLIEKNSAQFSLQPAVMEYVSDRLVEQVCQDLQNGGQLASKSLLKTHALLKAQAKDYSREAQIRLILTPIIKQLQANLASEASLKPLLGQTLSTLRGKSSTEVGYAGGNILNLLCQLEPCLQDYDFSDLTLWQADLRNTDLHHVNLSDSDLTHSVFSETLGIVFGIASSPDGSLLATGDAEGGLRLWQVATRKLLLNFEGHIGWVWSVAFSPDGQTLASCSSDKTIRLWDINTGKCLKVLHGHTSSIWSIAFSPDGQLLASGGDESIVRLWDLHTGECSKRLAGHTEPILSVAFNGPLLASGSVDRTVRVWDLNTGDCKQIYSGHHDRIWSISFSSDGKTLASGSADRTIRLWSMQTGACLKILSEHRDRVRCVKFSPDQQTLMSASDDKTIRVWDVQTGDCLNVLRGHTHSVFSLCFARTPNVDDSLLIASGSTDQTIRFWNPHTGRCLRTLKGYTNSVFSVAYHPDGQTLASGSTDQTVRLWDVETGTCLKTLKGHQGWVTSVAFHPNGNLVASSSVDRTVRVWSVQSGRCLRTLDGHTNWVQSVAFSPDGQLLASGSDDQTIRLWNVESGQCLTVLHGHTNWIWAIVFSSDGQLLASSSEDQTIRIWDIQTGNCLHVLAEHTGRIQSICFANSEHQLLASASSDQTVRLWNVQTGKCLKVLHGHDNNVWSVAFSPDYPCGEQDRAVLASGGLDQTVKIWDIQSGELLKTLPILTHSVRSSIVFNPSSSLNTLTSGSHNGTIKIWDAETGARLKMFVPDRPYQGTQITNVTGITAAQKAALQALGAIE